MVRIERVCDFLLRSPATGLTVKDSLIYITTVMDSLTILRLEPRELVEVFRYAHSPFPVRQRSLIPFRSSDDVARLCGRHLVLPDMPLTLVADQERSVSGIWYDSDRLRDCRGRSDDARNVRPGDLAPGGTAFEAELPINIVHFLHGPPLHGWRLRSDPCDSPPLDIKSSVAYPADPNLRLLGVGEDGSLFQFTLLTEDAFLLLRYVQNLAALALGADAPEIVRLDHAEPRATKPHQRHIDADLLGRVLEQGPAFIQDLFSSAPEHILGDGLDTRSSGRAYDVFRGLLNKVYDSQGRDPVEAFVSYLLIMLRPAV